MILKSHSAEETRRIGASLARQLRANDVVLLLGDMGAGKSELTRGIARGLGVTGYVTSPTFTIVNEYEGGRLPLFHFDMYRLRDADDLFDIGWEDFLRRGGICAVEWSENIRDALDEDTLWVDIRRGVTDGQRIITLHGPGLDGWDPDKPEAPEGRTP